MVEQRFEAIADEVSQRDKAKVAEEAKRHLRRAERTETSWPEASEAHRAKYKAALKRTPYSGHATANGVMRCLRAIWNYMDDLLDDADKVVRRNPVRLQKRWHKIKPRKRMLREDDFAVFHNAVVALENPIFGDYIRLLLFTGLRRGEASSLQWDDVDLRGRLLHIPINKSDRPFKLPMSDVVHTMLVARRAIGKTDYVFPADSKCGHITEPKFAFDQIFAATGLRLSPHDMRRSFANVAARCGISKLQIRALLNHAGADVTDGYIDLLAEELREPAQRIADKLKELCGVQEPRGENVAKMR